MKHLLLILETSQKSSNFLKSKILYILTINFINIFYFLKDLRVRARARVCVCVCVYVWH